MTIFQSTRQPISIPDIDIYSFLFSPNQFNRTRSPDRPLLIDGVTGKTLSFKQVRALTSKIALGWKENIGLSKGDVKHLLTHAFSSHIAEFSHQIQKSEAKAIVTIPALLPVLRKVAKKAKIPENRIFLFGNQTVGHALPFTLIASDHHSLIQLPIANMNPAEDLAFICFSSGTTGVAKGVMLTHRNFVSQILTVSDFEGTDNNQEDDLLIGFLPFYHIFGLTTLVLRAFYSNTPVVVVPKYNLETVCRLIEKYRITIAPIVPPVAPLGIEHIEALHLRVKAPVRQGYGLTETTAGCMYQKIGKSPAGASGVLVANMECKLVDQEGNEVGPDQPGEILFRGPMVMKGYLNDDKANAETFTKDDWMRTGDVAIYDSKSGEFYIIDRIKELIKYKGYQVAPAELEALLMSHKSVADCCVVGVYDPIQATELPRAYIVLQPSVLDNQSTLKMMSEFVDGQVVSYKRLRGGIRFIDQVPKSASGKILRRQVREWVKKEQQQEHERARI
ncbi:uncharacterized protein B0P05DRAFT_603517 [Gilbertella persicaria]|uniref:uncharacterized protein n=1 Tax=Gilbertella persicaria TaxID=101096 RepID=UPI00221EBEDA|nr:uncharacterized protein B0P05DRAFT_603517 [Gilbertella persicaria]KAI8081950.1 hypothetical protein B0P05DRAFT_603517 [Gilbertella persicaria]